MGLNYEADCCEQELEQFRDSKSLDLTNGSAYTREGDGQGCAVKDIVCVTQATKSKQAPSDSFISSQPSWESNDDLRKEIKDSVTKIRVDSRRNSDTPVSNSEKPVNAATNGSSRTNTSSRPQLGLERASHERSAAFLPFNTIQRSFTFDIFRSIAKDASRQVRSSIQRIGTDLEEKLTKENRRSQKRQPQRPKYLGDRLRIAVEHSPICDRNFLPDSALRELVTTKSVDEELAQRKYLHQRVSQGWRRTSVIRIEANENRGGLFKLRSRSTSQLLRQEAEQTYRRVFAILTFMDRSIYIWDFVEEGICDEVLPDLYVTPRGSIQRQGVEETKPLPCFRDWSLPAIHEFLNNRWIFLAPNFIAESKKAKHHVFKENDILPITSWTISSEAGASGEVYRARIQESHHTFGRDVVAVKQLKTNGAEPIKLRESFMHESNILRSLGRPNHMSQHLITLLATFERRDRYHLVFPWADGDLEDFWKQVSPQPSMSAWLIEQCRGLAEAMNIIHRYETTSDTIIPHEVPNVPRSAREETNEHSALSFIGRHGDIKPTNILWFRQENDDSHGILKITDFGIARFTLGSIEPKPERGYAPNSPTYRSPECDLPGKQIGAQCDVWALGCVFLVFVTWFFGGYDEVEKFATSRQSPDRFFAGANGDNFFTIESDAGQKLRAEVKPAVAKNINRLRIHPRCSEPFQKLLNLIEHDMVIIQKEPESAGANSMANSLEIPGAPRPRRMSAGNIAREIG